MSKYRMLLAHPRTRLQQIENLALPLYEGILLHLANIKLWTLNKLGTLKAYELYSSLDKLSIAGLFGDYYVGIL